MAADEAAAPRRRGAGLGALAACLLLPLLAAAACRDSGGQDGAPGPFLVELAPDAAHELLSKSAGDPGFIILDVRAPADFAAERIEAAVNLDISDSAFQDRLGGFDRGPSFFVYCQHGGRSAQAADTMQAMGFRRIYVLQGGLEAWKLAGFPLAGP
jgi:rhodanese-related sulfurtransferase